MKKLTRADLLSLEQYAEQRKALREAVMAHKRNRQVVLGEHIRLLFEDATTVRYQIQEMLRTERIFESAGIQEELDAYNPLIPDGDNWKATMLIEYEDVEERRHALRSLKGVEHRIWVRVGAHDPVYAIADEDLERENAEKTASVHFLRFQLTPTLARAAKAGEAIGFGVDHAACSETIAAVPDRVRETLSADLDG